MYAYKCYAYIKKSVPEGKFGDDLTGKSILLYNLLNCVKCLEFGLNKNMQFNIENFVITSLLDFLRSPYFFCCNYLMLIPFWFLSDY